MVSGYQKVLDGGDSPLTMVFSRKLTNRRISCLVFGFLDVVTVVDNTTKIRAIVVGRLSDSSDSAWRE
jgi:hypothetical protein